MSLKCKLAMLVSTSAILCSIVYKYVKLSDYWGSNNINKVFNDVLLYGHEDNTEKKKTIGEENVYSINSFNQAMLSDQWTYACQNSQAQPL